MGAFCVLLSLATGVDYGWQPAADGSLTYLIQVEPELVDELSQPGFAIESVIPDDLRGVRRFKIYVGRGEVPRVGSPHAAVQAQWSQYVEPTGAAGGSGTAYLNQNVPPLDPYGVANGYLPPALQTPVWSDQAVTKDSLYAWSELARDYLANGSAPTAAAGSGAPPLTLPTDFEQGIAALPGNLTAPITNAWDQASQSLRDRTGIDPRQVLPATEDRLKQEWNSGVAGAEAAIDRFGNRLADEANRTVGAWTGTEITRAPNPTAATSPVGTGGGAFAAAPPISQSASAPSAASNAGLGMPAGPAFSSPAPTGAGFNEAPRDFASAPAFNAPPVGAGAPPAGESFRNDGLGGSPLAGSPIAGGNSLDGGGLNGGSSLDAPPLTGSGFGTAPPLGGSLGGGGALGGGSSLGSTPGAGTGGWDAGGSLGGQPSSGLGAGLGGSLAGGGGLQGSGSLAGGGSLGGGSALDGGALGGGGLGGGSLGGDSFSGPGAGGSLGGPATLPGEQPFGVPQIGQPRPDDNPFGVPIVARTEVAKERRTLPYAAVPIRPDFSSDLLAGPSTIDVMPTSGPATGTTWNWSGSFDQNGRPWGPLFLTAVILFLSIGLNCYLAWISRGLYERYKNLVFSRRHSASSAAI